MNIEACQFFQPVTMKINDRRSPLVTAASNKTHDIVLEGLTIKIRPKNEKTYTYVTLNNTCWYILEELADAPSPSKADSARETKTRSKRNTVVTI